MARDWVRELGVAAYAGVPVVLDAGHAVGTACALAFAQIRRAHG